MSFRQISERAEEYITKLLCGPCRTKKDRLARIFLFLISRIYRALVQLRLTLYGERILRQRMLGCLVISIGNLTVGGTGKTPIVEVFTRTLAEKQRNVAILSRGYRSKKRPLLQKLKTMFKNPQHKPPPRVVSNGQRLLMNSAMAGDEPYMLANNLPEASVVVDKDRVKAGLYAIHKLGADTLILDDGFQYLDLRPRLNILLVDSSEPFHNHHMLPRGFLREPIKNVRRADYIFLTKSNGGSHIRHLKHFLKKHNQNAEIIECTHKPLYLEDVYSGKKEPLPMLKERKLASLSGIANPASFENFLEELGSSVVYSERFADHHRYRQQELIDFVNEAIANGAEMIVTTEKDAVRFPKLDRRDLPIYFLRVEIDILSGKESFNDCITRICFL